MSSIKLKGSTSGDVTITVPAVAGTNTLTLPAETGTVLTTNNFDLNGQELILDADGDTSITADTDDRIDLRVGGTDRAYITNNTIGGIINRLNAKPFIINGNFAVAQRGTSADGTSAYLIDRWKKQSQTTGNVTVSQDTDAPTGFINSQKMLASGASTFFQTGQQIEYKNFYPLIGKAVSLGFYYKSDVDVVIRIRTGTSTADSAVLFSGSVASTATASASAGWVQYVHNFTLASNVTSLSIEFGTGTLANTDFVYLAGVQLEQGTFNTTTIPPFQHESFGDNLARCQRYYQHTYDYGTSAGANTAVGFVGCNAAGTAIGRVLHGLPIRPSMRAIPTITVYSTDGTSGTARRGDAGTNVTVGAGNASRNAFHVENSAVVTDGEQIQFQYRLVSEF